LGLTIFTNQIPEPEEFQENIIVVFPVAAVSYYSTMDFYSKSLWTKLDYWPGNATSFKRSAYKN
jgi:hypothetical protein